MKNDYFLALENGARHSQSSLSQALKHLAYNADGLVPVITQDAETKDVLMMAWMNYEAIQKTLASGRMVYWSRSRKQFWKKGETSGHIQQLQEMRLDCDGDAILCLVKQTGAACHTGRKDCFYLSVNTADNSIYITSSIGEELE